MNYVAYGFLILIYSAFAWFGKAPVEGLLAVITGAITALGAHHAISSAATRATQAANIANPVPLPNVPTAPTTITKE